mmetsp:Transcript_9143/g.17217  ORF Transcript_9143/g.17217 Transcript_9143/m.17217 type:complete len:753 (+) Transcript_9143:319-2577(+)
MHVMMRATQLPRATQDINKNALAYNDNQLPQQHQMEQPETKSSRSTSNKHVMMMKNESNRDNASASVPANSERNNPHVSNDDLKRQAQDTNKQEYTMHHDVPTYTHHDEGFNPPPIVEHNVGAASKDDVVSDYSDGSLNGDKGSLLDEERNDYDRHQDGDDDEDYDEYGDDDDIDVDGDDDNDDQPVKLFIGQVPKQMEEPDLFAIFEKYGPMEDVAIIRDKHTGQHRGCAFVTFLQKESAEQCEKELHGTFVFEGGKRPVQVRPAGWKEENKIFVGMLPKDVTEEMVFRIFEPYGEITGVFVIQSTDGYRKGCAFVKFVNRMDAHRAIEELHNKVVFENSDRPLIVKIADSKKEKNKMPSRATATGNKQGRYASSRNSSGHGGSTSTLLYSDPNAVSSASQLNPLSQEVYYMPPLHGQLGIAHPSSSTHQQQSHGHLAPHPVYPGHMPGMEHLGRHVALPMDHALNHSHHDVSLDHFNPMFPSHAYPVAYMEHGYDPSNPQPHASTRPTHSYPNAYLSPEQQMVLQSNARPREGPAGANLFIYHLPHDLTDADLATAFNPFGNVISAKVFVDKVTGDSKGFGFVSYDSVISAEQAIELMNGFQIGNKRLKVQHKRIHHHPRHTDQMSVPMSAAGLAPGVSIGGIPNQMHHLHPPYMYPYAISTLGHQHVSGDDLTDRDAQQFIAQRHGGINGNSSREEIKGIEAARAISHSADSNIHHSRGEGTNQTQVSPVVSQELVDDLTQQFDNRLKS